MRILYHHRVASKDGQYVHIVELVSALRRRGHEVRVVGPAAVEREAFGAGLRAVERLRRHLPGALYELLELAYGAPATLRLLREARRFRPALLYERYNLHLPAGMLVRRLTGVPLLLEVNAPLARERAEHGGLALPRLARTVEGAIWRGADRVLAVSEVLAGMVGAAGVPRERLRIVPNGVDLASFADLDRDRARRALGFGDACVLGFVGFVREWHGLDRAVRFLADGPGRGCALVVGGDGPARPGLERLADALGVGGRVRFLGTVPRDDVPGLVAAFDVALQPAVVPWASPLKLFEYMAAGRAILAPDSPNIREVVRDGVEALLFPPEGFARALARLVADPALRTRLGRAAREAVYRRDRSWEANAALVEMLATELGVAPGAGVADEPAASATSAASSASLSSHR